jgi:hypothetical protein
MSGIESITNALFHALFTRLNESLLKEKNKMSEHNKIEQSDMNTSG